MEYLEGSGVAVLYTAINNLGGERDRWGQAEGTLRGGWFVCRTRCVVRGVNLVLSGQTPSLG
jgi:hypothetical protein